MRRWLAPSMQGLSEYETLTVVDTFTDETTGKLETKDRQRIIHLQDGKVVPKEKSDLYY